MAELSAIPAPDGPTDRAGRTATLLSSLRLLVGSFSPATRRKLVLAVIGSLVLAVVEIVGLLAVLPLMQLLTGARPDSSRFLSLLGRVIGSEDPSRLVFAATGLMFAIFLVKGIASVSFRWWTLGFLYREEAQTARHLLSYYIRAPYWLHLERNSAELTRVMNESVGIVFSNVVVGAVTAASEGATILLILVTLFVVMPLPTLGFALYFAAAGYAFTRLMRSRSLVYGRAMNDASLGIYQSAGQVLGGVKEIKIRNDPEHFVAAYGRARTSYAWARRRVSFANELPKYFLEIFFITGLGIFTVVVFTLTTSDQALPMLALLAAAGFRVLPSVGRFIGSLNGMRVGLPSLDLVLTDMAAAQQLETQDVQPEQALELRRTLAVEKVSFRYRGSDRDVLDSVSFTVPAGSSVAIVGPSGSGKSTLVDVMLGLHTPRQGRVTIDGSDIRSHLPSWQRAIGMVPQDVYLLDDTLRANVAFGEPPDRVDEERLHRALRRAQLDSLVRELPAGAGTLVGERGARISGGQRQRVGIARALYLEPKVLVLDEATSALDSQTESRITSTIEDLRGEITVVVVAHRLSTVRKCDLVVFLDQGSVAAAGSFARVTAVNRDFAHLVELGRLDLTQSSST